MMLTRLTVDCREVVGDVRAGRLAEFLEATAAETQAS
jgi:hypothetical protein